MSASRFAGSGRFEPCSGSNSTLDGVDPCGIDLSWYMKHMSPGLDAGILGKSIWTILSGFGAQ